MLCFILDIFPINLIVFALKRQQKKQKIEVFLFLEEDVKEETKPVTEDVKEDIGGEEVVLSGVEDDESAVSANEEIGGGDLSNTLKNPVFKVQTGY